MTECRKLEMEETGMCHRIKSRRDFLFKLATTTAGAGLGYEATQQTIAAAVGSLPSRNEGNAAEVPATVELAEHGRMAINGILGLLDLKIDYESVFLNILDVHPAYMVHWSTMVSGVMPKFVEALPLLRQMTGSNQDRDIEMGFLEAMGRNMEEDGLVYDRATPKRPWNVGVSYGKPDWDEDYANMAGNGRLLAGLTYWHQATGDEFWRKKAKKTAERMLELAVVQDDYAWYPNPGVGNDFSYPRKSGWTTNKPPEKSNEGVEGATLFYLFQPLRGFARYFALTGDERFLSLSRKFVNFGLQQKFWGGANDLNPKAGAERGHFQGHFHGTLAGLRGLLDYAQVANDGRVRVLVRDSYEWARQMGVTRLGLFPHHRESTEGCTIADMVGLAVALTDAGMGDYWDDVEMFARNGLISAQATDIEELKRVSQQGRERLPQANWGGHFDGRFEANNKGVLPGQEIHDRVLERSQGAFGHLWGARYQVPMMMSCCTANDSQALYYAWEGIVRRDGLTAAVNMWMNRRSPWVDVWSWLPHEGRVVVQNKGLKRIIVRKPSWARRVDVRCQIGGKDVTPVWIGNRMIFDELKGNEPLTITAPVVTEKAHYTMLNLNDPKDSTEEYDCEFKGHTVLSVQRTVPGTHQQDSNWYRLFRRESMRAAKSPMAPMAAYVHPAKLVNWFLV